MSASRFLRLTSLAVGLLLAGSALAVPPDAVPEVDNLRFTNRTDFEWDPLGGVDSYNVYRGDLATLPVDYGNCFDPVVPVPAGQDLTPDPLPGQAFVYLVTAAKGTQEGTLGFDSSPTQRPNVNPCLTLPPPLLDTIDPNGPDVDAVVQGRQAARNPGIANDLTGLAGGAVYLHTLEFFIEQVDLELPGRGPSWRHARAYRSQINHDGQQGRNWTFNYDRRVLPNPLGPGLLHLDGTGREDLYLLAVGTIFEPVAPGLYTKLNQNLDGTFTLRERDGTLYRHFGFDGDPTDGRLSAIVDRAGNRLSFIYHPNGLLCSVVDTLGRTINYYWNAGGRLHMVEDFAGRQVRYEYDSVGNLITATRPPVVGTSTGNDFPAGKTLEYTYSAGPPGTPLAHNLETVRAPGDATPVIQNVYNGDDELESQFYGGTNASGVPAGGLYQYAIPVKAGFRETEVFDRRGALHRFQSDPEGHVTREEIGTSQTEHAYNSTGERIGTLLPLTNRIEYEYDEFNPDRFQRGNLLVIRRIADPVRADGHTGAPLPDIQVTYEYEPLYTQQRVIVDPGGRATEYVYDYQEGDPLTNGVIAQAGDWQINLGLVPLSVGDANGDGLDDQAFGNPVRLQQPTVTLLPGGRQEAIEGGPFQPIATRYRYDGLGRLVVEIDPEHNVDTYVYYPEIDPDGDGLLTPPPLDGRPLSATAGGYLAAKTLDADPAPFLTPVEIARRNNGTNPAPAKILNDYEYDSVGNLIRSIDGNGVATTYEVNALGQVVSVRRGRISDRSINLDPDPPLDGFFSEQHYNERDEIVLRRVQDLGDLSGTGGTIETEFVYDSLGNVVRLVQETGFGGSVVTEYRYDAEENRTAVIQPEGNRQTSLYDERDLLVRLVRGDDNLDAADGGPPGSSTAGYEYDANGNLLSYQDGRGQLWPFVYDGMDRRTRAEIFPAESFFDVYYNPDETVGRIELSDLAILLFQASFEYDELGRTRAITQTILGPGGVPIPESADGDEFVTAYNEYDRNSRRSRVVDDFATPRDFDYDGAGRVLRQVDALGNETGFQYDANNNVLQTFETEVDPAGVLPVESFVTVNQYDRLNRLTLTADNAGNTSSLAYDSRDNLISLIDKNTNQIVYRYDAMNNRIEIRKDPDGLDILYTFEYDGNGRVRKLTDPESNSTEYLYDDLNRKVADIFADGTLIDYQYDGNDNVVRLIDANGSVIDIAYDAADRPRERSIAPAPGVHASSQTFDYDGMNRLVSAQDFNDFGPQWWPQVQFVYDSLNRIREETTQFGVNPPRTLTFTYDGNGNRTSANYGFGSNLGYSYDPLNRLVEMFDAVNGFSAGYDYMGPERVTQRRHGNGTRKSLLDPAGTAAIGYDPLKRAVGIFHYDPFSNPQAGFDYEYDAVGHIRVEGRDLHNPGVFDAYEYDAANRLIRFDRDQGSVIPGSPPETTEYVLDRVGNWLQRIVNGVPFGNTPNNLNEYGEKPDDGIPDDFGDNLTIPGPDGINLGHDPGGDLITEGSRRYEYDAFHRLVAVEDGGSPVARYVYDPLNRRIAKVDSATGGQRYVYDGDDVVQTIGLALPGPTETVLERRFYPGIQTEIIALELVGVGPPGVHYLHDDARGSTVMVTDPFANVVERVTYDAYGEPRFEDPGNNPTGATESLFTPFLYQGKFWDPETRLYEDRGAMFAPRLGRHLQRFVPGQNLGPQASVLDPPMFFPCPWNWFGMNPFWWCKGWFWHPGVWNGGWWAWNAVWWLGGVWGWWWWQPWLWFGALPFANWWVLKPWWFWWCGPFKWWGWPAWWNWGGWWGFWPFWGWFGWKVWLPYWGWWGWQSWWPWWGWWGWTGWWPSFGWWGWCGWWPWWNVWSDWHPWWWWGWWTWTPWWWHGFWGWSGLTFWWNWWSWTTWWPWAWWNWAGWCWWGWFGWNPWWWWGWWSWWSWGWVRGFYWWWGPVGWWPWFGWGWVPWWWWGWWAWLWPWGWWLWGWGGWAFWGWFRWWGWWWNWWAWPWWGWTLWWGWWWPWWGWWG